MNYIREINAFYDQQETNPLSSTAIAVWYALMHIRNKAGWPIDFSVAASVVCLKAGVKERNFYNSRNELKQKGYLTFESRKGNQAAVYRLLSLSAPYADKLVDNEVDSYADKVGDSVTPLYEQKNIKQNITTKKVNPFLFYEENGFGMLSPFISEDINTWLSDGSFLEPEDIVIEAMKIAILKNVRNWRYVSKILQDWQSRKLQTLKAIQAEQENWRKRVTPFPQKGGQSHDTRKRASATDYTGYDFRF
ncbi:DnaD domain-containing protein [Halalkalibacter akibai]|uniref:Phage replication protein n=1 Tax=Halalkalibacter akibai (strain ATCC 43226 / DSM 21942 / CIP 109018 / JCM 9157 / 1139) TaxID=1236973 RepID=W4QZA5_HALA3|nr:DnaD domain protein [Halalkalibacter akibai]GAE36644.1 phage replication protein [Halalkalibacter akibai JCM 9157]